MILTENDLVCLVEEDEIDPQDYLKEKINVLNKGFFYYSVDNNKTIRIISCIEDTNKLGVIPFYKNIVKSKDLNLVDTMHGYMPNCRVQNFELMSRFGEAPEVNITAEVNNLKPWDKPLDVECYNVDKKEYGLMKGHQVNAIGKKSVQVRGMYLKNTRLDFAPNSNISSLTIHLSANIKRNGIVDVKQIFALNGDATKDLSDISIINNLAGKIAFNNNTVDVAFGNISFSLLDVKFDKVSYVFDMMELPSSKQEDDDVDMEIFKDGFVALYRLYYSGRIYV